MVERLRLQIESDVNMNSLIETQILSDNTGADLKNSGVPEWSKADQQELDALVARRTEFMNRRSDEVLEPFKEIFKGLDLKYYPYAGNAIRAKALDIIRLLMPEARALRGLPTKAFVFPINLKWDGLIDSTLIQLKFPLVEVPSWDASGVREALAEHRVLSTDSVSVDDSVAVASLSKRHGISHLVVVRLYD